MVTVCSISTFADHGIDTRGHTYGQVKTLCPKCSHNRKKSHDPCLSVNIDEGIWNCHHCGWFGSLGNGHQGHHQPNGHSNGSSYAKPDFTPPARLSEKVLAWFSSRGIPESVLKRNYIGEGVEWMPQIESEVNCIQFPYIYCGEVLNVKFRDARKNFKMVKGARRVLYKHDDISTGEGSVLIWCEGEMDALSMEVAGYKNTVSVPNGASGKLDFLDDCMDRLNQVCVHIIAVDNDEPGQALQEKLINRLGRKKCKIVEWPEGCKDANEVLVQHGEAKLADCIQNARTFSTNSTNSTENEIWEDPILFDGIGTPDIPAELLPSWLGDYAGGVSQNTQTPGGLSVLMGLSAAAACIQKRFEVCPFGDDYTEPLAFWSVTVLPPASRKTAVVNAMTFPLSEWEKEQYEALREEIVKNETVRAVNLKAIEKLQQKASQTKSTDDRIKLVEEINKLKLETPEEILPPRLWTSDVTPERFQSLMAEHGERMALLSDEGGIFEIMAGLYSDGKANVDVFLQSHAGRPVRVDRGTRTVNMNKPASTFGLTIQPEIMKDFSRGNKKRFRGIGILARYIYCLPHSNIGKRDVAKREIIPETIKRAYRNGIYSLLSIPPVLDEKGVERPRILRLDNEAMTAWLGFAKYIEVNQGDGKEFEPIQEWTGKLPGAALRIAGICHVVGVGDSDPIIKGETMANALDLCELLIKHAQAAFTLMGAEQDVDDAKYILEWIVDEKALFFKRTDCHRKFHGRFKRVERLLKALEILKERHIIGPEERLGTRKPTLIYSVNPKLLSEAN